MSFLNLLFFRKCTFARQAEECSFQLSMLILQQYVFLGLYLWMKYPTVAIWWAR